MQTGNITLLQMNDVYGYLEPHPELVWYGSEQRYPILDGYARMATLVSRYAAKRTLPSSC
jgi:sulfur-oxidizing protein SoxB